MKFKQQLSALILSSLAALPASADISKGIEQALSSSDRTASDAARDAKRKPGDILSILGVKAGDKIVDLSSGGGYYTHLLSHIVGKKGSVTAHNTPYVVNRFASFFQDEKDGWPAKLNSPQWKTNVVKAVEELDSMSFGVGLDGALMVLFYHDTVWQQVNRQMMNQHLFNALKPGGSFVIVDHSAKAGSKDQEVKSFHRIDKQFVIDEVTKAGFVLEMDSDVLANKKDTRDFNVFRDARTNRDSTDRFVLKFVKPAK